MRSGYEINLGVVLTLEAHFKMRRLSAPVNTFFQFYWGGGEVGLGFWSKRTYVNRFFQGPRQCSYSDCEVSGVPGRCCNDKIPAAQSTLQYQMVISLGSFKFTLVFFIWSFLLFYSIPWTVIKISVSFCGMHHLVHNNLVFFAVLPSIFDYLLSFQTGCNYHFCLSLAHLQLSLT